MHPNPLLEHLSTVLERVTLFRTHAKTFYYEVLLSVHTCPHCGGQLTTSGISQAACLRCGAHTDPTVAFQRSACCNASLVKKRTHYVCAECSETVPSRFLFDEVLHDGEYFADKMRESRERKRRSREERRLLLAQSRSDELSLTEVPDIELIPGLVEALADFLEHTAVCSNEHTAIRSDFRMEAYRQIILGSVGNAAAYFDAIPAIDEDSRLDRARRFITLIFMEHGHEVRLEQMDTGILVIPCA